MKLKETIVQKRKNDPNRVGIFTLPEEVVRLRWRDLIPVFATVVILKADWDPAAGVIRYMAFCEDFEEVIYGTRAFEYTAIVNKSNNSVRWLKLLERKI